MLNLGPDYPEELALIAESVYQALARSGVAPMHCASAALEAAEEVRKRIGGAQIYIPMGQRIQATQRRAAVMDYLANHPGDYQGAARFAGVAENTARRIELQARSRANKKVG